MVLIGVAMVFTFSCLMSFSSPDSSETQFFFPFLLRGFGMGFMMTPIMGMALQGISGGELAQATGLRNMVRQLGGAVGIAVLNIYLVHRTAANDSYLLQHVNIYSEQVRDKISAFTANFLSAGYDAGTAEQLAYKMLDMTLYKQQALVSYNNVFWIGGICVLAVIPFLFFIQTDKKAKMVVDDGH
jgi:DHA2 family multidrug resistance protein